MPFAGRSESGCVRSSSVVVEEGRDEPVVAEARHVAQGFRLGHAAVPVPDAQPAGQVVEPQRRRVGLGHRCVHDAVLPEQRDQEGEWVHQVGGVVEQPLALGQVLVDEPVLLLLEVAQPAVYELRGLRRRARSPVVALDDGGPQPARRRVEGDSGAGDPAADH